jgi:cell division protein ZapB
LKTTVLFGIPTMTQAFSEQPIELALLENKVDLLIARYHTVKHENQSLKTQQDLLQQEKILLLEKTTLARTRVEAMINRLKAMEQGL